MIAHLQVVYVNGCAHAKCDHTMASNPPRSLCAWHADSEQLFNLFGVENVFVASWTIGKALDVRGLA